MSRQPPKQQPPPVQKIQLRYSKLRRMRFASHRDFARAFERALRRAAVPMAYSSGFTPHPRISYANAAPTGAATDAEYLEIGLAEVRDPAAIAAALNEQLPDGFWIEAARESPGGKIADELLASHWILTVCGAIDLGRSVEFLLQADTVLVERKTKSGIREFDVRPAIVHAAAVEDTISVVLNHTVPLVRPDDVVLALSQIDPEFPGSETVLAHRHAQGLLHGNRVHNAF